MTRIIYNYIMPHGLSKLILFEPNKVLEIFSCVLLFVSFSAAVCEMVLMMKRHIIHLPIMTLIDTKFLLDSCKSPRK